MKKIIKIIATFILLSQLSLSSFAYNYTFSSGADSKTTFDKSTQSGDFTVINPYENVRNNKDAAYSPPPYGIFSGDIPTDPSSLYHTADKPSTVTTTSNVTYSSYTSSSNSDTTANLPDISAFSSDEMLASTSVYSDGNAKILPMYYSDGSIGKLEFPKFGKSIKVYEGESMENMRLGAGHMSGTSAWDGNCVIAAHNRGVPNNFSFLKNMNVGDKVKYTSQYGTRTYEVVTKTQIAVDDLSCLEWSAENILSLLTCVEGVPEKRLLVVCIEIVN